MIACALLGNKRLKAEVEMAFFDASAHSARLQLEATESDVRALTMPREGQFRMNVMAP
jgi:hypothetical protein